MGQNWNSLKGRQKVTLIAGDVIALLGLINIIRSIMSTNYSEVHLGIGFVFIIIGAVILMVGYFDSPEKEKLFIWTSIIYILYAFIIFGIALKEQNLHVYELAVVTALLSLVGMNIAIFRPTKIKIFGSINIIAVVIGLAVVSMAIIEEDSKHSKVYSLLGSILISVAAVTSNLSIYGVG